MKIRYLRASYFIWIIVPLATYLGFLSVGLPHIIWSYSYRDHGQKNPANPFSGRWYTRCTYIGPYAAFSTAARDGQCDWFRFHKKQTEK